MKQIVIVEKKVKHVQMFINLQKEKKRKNLYRTLSWTDVTVTIMDMLIFWSTWY